MGADRSDTKAAASELGELLRYWRGVRGASQLGLSLEAGISQRQISFIESGRSVPGRDTLLTLAQALEVPLRERNALLLAAGYAPVYAEPPWNAQEMQGVIRALERLISQHEPFPAIVMDRHWNVLMNNQAALRLFGSFIDMAARQEPRNMLHLIFDPRGLRPFLATGTRWRAACCSACIARRWAMPWMPARGACSTNCSPIRRCRATGARIARARLRRACR